MGRTRQFAGLALASMAVLMCTPQSDYDDGPSHIHAVPSTSGGGGNGGDASSSGASTGAGAEGAIPPEACKYTLASVHDLPTGFGTDQLDRLSADSGETCVEGELSYATRDMDGDRRPDLVVADRCDLAGVGTTEWLVYLSTGYDFAETPISWTLPGGFSTDQLDDLSDDSGATCVEGQLSFDLRDMDGDLRPDLVVADNCDLGGVGSTHWAVYLNLGDRFASVAVDWALPTGFATDQLADLAGDSGGSCGEGELSFATVDMNGDRRPDLVVTDNCDLDTVGTDHWLVYENLGDGFAASATSWTLPTGFSTDDFDDIAAADFGSCGIGKLSFGLRDMDGDLSPDLVVTDNCDAGEVGSSHWLVYLNQGDRFADNAILWTLHSQTTSDQYDALAGDSGAGCVFSELSYGVLDADGDGAADLVVTDRCDTKEVGSTHWLLYRANLTRFEEAASWSLPSGAAFDALDDLEQTDADYCVQGQYSTAAIDMDGDGVLDLVEADDCDLGHVGTTHWRVFYGSCAPVDP